MITCPNGHKENRNSARYCKKCGAVIAAASDKLLVDVVGKKNALLQIEEMVATYDLYKQNHSRQKPEMDILILGSTGSGKTYLASVIQSLFFSKAMISNPQIIRIDAPEYEQWAEHLDDDTLKKLKGSILFIDNVHLLMTDPIGLSPIDQLLSLMEKWENDHDSEWDRYPMVIFAGEKGTVEEYFKQKKNGKNRFGHSLILPDLSAEELNVLCIKELTNLQLNFSSEVKVKLLGYFKQLVRNRKVEFRNAFEAIYKCEEIYRNCLTRKCGNTVIPEDISGDIFNEQNVEDILKKLDGFVGIGNIKSEVHGWIENIAQYRLEQQDPQAIPPFWNQYIFLGNPGTGKTTIARLFADILQALNILPNGQLIEVTREDLVGEYIGSTAPKTKKAVESAMGGVLFIDEAYTLTCGGNSDFGREALNTLLKPVEEKRGQFVCILAGYTEEMQDLFNSNSGIKSRFNKILTFEDYKPHELTMIFKNLLVANFYTADEEASNRLPMFFEKIYRTRTRHFGNARNVVNAFNEAVRRHRERLTNNHLPPCSVLSVADIEGDEALKEISVEGIVQSVEQEFIGMESVKQFVRDLAILKSDMDERLQLGLETQQTLKLNIILTGNPGTGKTSVARKLGRIFNMMKLLPSDEVIERQRKDIVGKYTNSSGEEMAKVCDLAMGKVLFIDEAYSFAPVNDAGTKDEEATKAIEVLMKRMEDDAGKFAVILAGYPNLMDNFIRTNDGIARRITHRIHIEDYSSIELVDIFKHMSLRQGYCLAPDTEPQLFIKVNDMLQQKSNSWGNAGEMAKLLEATKARLALRVREIPKTKRTAELFQTIMPVDIPFDAPKTLSANEALAKLDDMVGLTNIKTQIRQMIASFKIEEERAKLNGNTLKRTAPHYIFTGNPGTGKTTVAKLMADILTSSGVLSRGHLVEVTEKDLVAGYIGQTAIKTSHVIDSALGGLLFIDEAYSLNKGSEASGGGFGQEAINTLLERLTKDAGKFVCVLAGYKKEMKEFVLTNPGLDRRFRKIEFDDYNPEELGKIFENLLTKDTMRLDEYAKTRLPFFFNKLYETRNPNTFGNAGTIVNIYNQAKERQGKRLLPSFENGSCSKQESLTLTYEDITGENVGKDISVGDLMKVFDRHVGLVKAKEKMSLILNQIKLNRKRAEITNKSFFNINSNFVFIGNANTGKEEFAHSLSKVYKTIDLIENENITVTGFEVFSRYLMSGMDHVVDEEWDKASCGMIFFNNTGALLNSPKKNEIEATLIKKIHADKGKTICVINTSVDEWDSIAECCPWLYSTFQDVFVFEDYSAAELSELFIHHVTENGMMLTDEAKSLLPGYFSTHSKHCSAEISFLFNQIIRKQNIRLANSSDLSNEALVLIETSDIIES